MRFVISLSIDIDDPPNTILEVPPDEESEAFITQRSYVEAIVEAMTADLAPMAEFGYARIDVDTGRSHPDFVYNGLTHAGPPILRTVSISAPPGDWSYLR